MFRIRIWIIRMQIRIIRIANYMESLQEIKKLISEAKNICVIPSDNYESESIPGALALFYTLKELGKNVNLLIGDFPKTFNFLVPSLDYISTPKNFVLSIPKSVADVSQVYYEKNEDNLKIHLTIEKGSIKKDNISFYFADAKPDLVITLGIQDFQKQLSDKLDSFGFILDSPILNIDSSRPAFAQNKTVAIENKKFGSVNIVENRSLSEILLDIITPISASAVIKKNQADCLLAGLITYYNNFQDSDMSPEIFELCAKLMKSGANRQGIIEKLYPKKNQSPSIVEDNTIPLLQPTTNTIGA